MFTYITNISILMLIAGETLQICRSQSGRLYEQYKLADKFTLTLTPCGLQASENRPDCFLARCRKKHLVVMVLLSVPVQLVDWKD